MTEENQDEILHVIRRRRASNRRWELINFIAYQLLLLISIFASFGSAILAAANVMPSIVIALLTAIPGVAIVLDRSFLFADRWRWHNAVSTQYSALENMLVFEGKSIEHVSKAMGEYQLLMETKYPSHAKVGEISVREE
jgi:hypothetical protein